MQAMAPGSSSEAQAGHFVGTGGLEGATTGLGGAATPPPPAPSCRFGAEPRLTLAADGVADAPGTMNGLPQPAFGQRNCLPAEPSGSCMALEQCGQLMMIGMVNSYGAML